MGLDLEPPIGGLVPTLLWAGDRCVDVLAEERVVDPWLDGFLVTIEQSVGSDHRLRSGRISHLDGLFGDPDATFLANPRFYTLVELAEGLLQFVRRIVECGQELQLSLRGLLYLNWGHAAGESDQCHGGHYRDQSARRG